MRYKIKGEVETWKVNIGVKCIDCDNEIGGWFDNKEDFEIRLQQKGWESRFGLWYCPECVKNFEYNKRKAGR